MLGFSYNGFHCSKFGICMKSKSRPLFPQIKSCTEEVMDRDGVYDFSEANTLNRPIFKNKEIIIECNYVSKNHNEVVSNAQQIASWLFNGSKKLIFDDSPNLFYNAILREKIDLTLSGKRGSFVLVFDCDPYAYSVSTSSFTHSLTKTSDSFSVINNGYYVFPDILVYGTFKNLKIECMRKIIKFNGSGEGLLQIDNKNKTAILNGSNVLPLISGEFFELAPGPVTIYTTADENNASMIVSFYENYL